ncbi:MAG: hypothetical protein V4534_05305 [Myxococcota bacterium]
MDRTQMFRNLRHIEGACFYSLSESAQNIYQSDRKCLRSLWDSVNTVFYYRTVNTITDEMGTTHQELVRRFCGELTEAQKVSLHAHPSTPITLDRYSTRRY